MRIGTNPQKDRKFKAPDFFHQVILPVYIPSLTDYFTESLGILKLCLKSLIASSHSKTYITVVNNGSCNEVAHYLDNLLSDGSIHELIHTTNIGKVNSISKGLAGQQFPLVTISDSDVLFQTGWQRATYEIFDKIPKTGAVSTTPNPRTLKYLSSNILFERFFSNALKFTEVQNPQALKAFAVSIGNENFFNPVHYKKNLTISQGGIRAVVGCGHFVCTYRGEIFKNSALMFSPTYIGGKAITQLIDSRVTKKDYWRLSTEENYTYHMGNHIEGWMEEKAANIKRQDDLLQPILKSHKSNHASIWLKTVAFPELLFTLTIWRWFLKYKGLSKPESDSY